MAKKQSEFKNSFNLNKTKGKKFKIIGACILLMSFSTEKLLLSHFNEKIEGHFSAYLVYSSSYNSGLIYQNLYFSHALATNVADGTILRKAAQDNWAGFSVNIMESEISENEKSNIISQLKSKADEVKDIDSFNDYMNSVNKHEYNIVQKTTNDYRRLSNFKIIFSKIYFILYIMGALFTLIGMKYE